MHHLDGSMTSENRSVSKSRHFILLGGVRHRNNYFSKGARYLLPHLRKEILMRLQDDPTPEHFIFFKNYERIRRPYLWRQIQSSIYKYIAYHVICQRRIAPLAHHRNMTARCRAKQNANMPWQDGLLQPPPPPLYPFQRFRIDLLGHLPPSTLGNQSFVIVIDHSTGYVITAVLPSGSSAEIENFFIQRILLKHGAPRV